MATGLYFGSDDRIKSILDEFFEKRLKEFGESHALVLVTEEKKFQEAIVGLAFDVIFVEQALLNNPKDWIASFLKSKPNSAPPVILVGGETDTMKIYHFVESGWKDYLYLPPDRPLVIEKFWMHTTGSRGSDIRQVYTLALKEAATLARFAQLVELSEMDCKLLINFPVQKEDLMILYSKAFALEDENEGLLLGRCYHIEAPNAEGLTRVSFYFVGASDERLKAIRSALRRSYVQGKR